MKEFMIEVVNQFGYAGIFLMIAVENIFPPIPSEVILTFSGFMTTYTETTVWGVVVAATLGSVAGALILYSIGRFLSANRLEGWLDGRWGRRLRFKHGDVRRAVAWFARNGSSTVFFCRCIPIVRSLISIPAGMAKMPMLKFIVLTMAGSAIWNTALVGFGAVAGDAWEKAIHFVDTYFIATVAIFAVQGAIFAFLFYKKRVAKK